MTAGTVHAPSQDQLAKERAVFWTALADAAILTLQIIFAIATQSLTLLSEFARGLLLWVLEVYSLLLLRAVHRRRLRSYRFGVGKVEELCSCAIGLAMALSALWIAERVVATVFGGTAATPLGLALAAVVNAINTLVNGMAWIAMFRAKRRDDSPIYRAQLRTRSVKLVSSSVAQVTMTPAALAGDPAFAVALDALGATFVVGLMLVIGLRLAARSLPDLLDYRVPANIRARLEAASEAAALDSVDLLLARTRRCGSVPHVELVLRPATDNLALLRRQVLLLRRHFARELPHADLSIALELERGGRFLAGPVRSS